MEVKKIFFFTLLAELQRSFNGVSTKLQRSFFLFFFSLADFLFLLLYTRACGRATAKRSEVLHGRTLAHFLHGRADKTEHCHTVQPTGRKHRRAFGAMWSFVRSDAPSFYCVSLYLPAPLARGTKSLKDGKRRY